MTASTAAELVPAAPATLARQCTEEADGPDLREVLAREDVGGAPWPLVAEHAGHLRAALATSVRGAWACGGEPRDVAELLVAFLVAQSERTAIAYGSDLADFGAYLQTQGVGLLEVSRRTIEAYLAYLERGDAHGGAPARGRTVAGTTRQRRLACLRAFYDYCLDVPWADEILGERNPAQRVARPKAKSAAADFLSREHVLELVAFCERQARQEAADARRRRRGTPAPWIWRQHHAMVCGLYDCALRISGLLSLRAADLKEHRGDPHIDVELKGRGKDRTLLPVTPRAHEALQSLARLRERTIEPLFLSPTGRQLTPTRAAQLLQGVCRQAGVPGVSPHALRHSALTHAIQLGADIRHAQKSAEHAHITTTQGYVHDEPGYEHAIGHLLETPRALPIQRDRDPVDAGAR